MIPLRIEDSRPGRSPTVKAIIIVNAAVFLYELSLGAAVDEMILRFGLIPYRLLVQLQETPWHAWKWAPPLLTHMFLHGGWLHVIGNMWFLWVFGRYLEKRMGPGRMLFLYLFGGVLASLAHVAAGPGLMVPMVGASGAVATILGGFLVLSPLRPVLTVVPILFFPLLFELPAAVVLVLWFLEQLVAGFFSLSVAAGQAAGVAWWAHIAGFIVGLLMVRLLVKRGWREKKEPQRAEEPPEEPKGRRQIAGYDTPRFWRIGERSSRETDSEDYDVVTVYDRWGRPTGRYVVKRGDRDEPE